MITSSSPVCSNILDLLAPARSCRPGRPWEPQGQCESNPRARQPNAGDSEGPNSATPSARLVLQRQFVITVVDVLVGGGGWRGRRLGGDGARATIAAGVR